jgi:hypothetical protein
MIKAGAIASLTARRMRAAGCAVHDDTEVQTGETVSSTGWLQAHEPAFIPFVNQVSGASGPQTLARTKLFISAPEQYPNRCPNGNCSDPSVNVTSGALRQMAANANNALVDARFGLHSWPLFQLGAGNGPLHGRASPDNGTMNVRSESLISYHVPRGGCAPIRLLSSLPCDTWQVRSDSLVRWMVYSAVAYGAKGLNYYCCTASHEIGTHPALPPRIQRIPRIQRTQCACAHSCALRVRWHRGRRRLVVQVRDACEHERGWANPPRLCPAAPLSMCRPALAARTRTSRASPRPSTTRYSLHHHHLAPISRATSERSGSLATAAR